MANEEKSEFLVEKSRPTFVSYEDEPRGRIFISYRRDDAPGFALSIYQCLEQEFRGEDLFMDVEGQIKPGDDFVKVLSNQIAQCNVLLAIIGERWIDARDKDGNRRLEQKDDFVRIEIASALELGKRVIPVLVNKAEMPHADELPEPLKVLARRNAIAIRLTRFKADVQGLVNGLKDALASGKAERAATNEAKRQAVEKERKRQEAKSNARAPQVEATARQNTEAGLTPNSFPDWTIRELFLHIDPNILSAGEARRNAIASKVRDELSVGKLRAWGRNDARRSFGKNAPLEEIGKDYWLNGSLEPYFFLAGEDHRWLVHAKPEPNLSGPHYRDIHVSKSQVMGLWPQPSLAFVPSD